MKNPSWEHAACIVEDTVAVAVPGVLGTGILKAGKYAKKISSLFNKGRKVVAKFKPAVKAVKTFGKKVGGRVVRKASKVLNKGKNLVNKKLLPRTKKAINKAKNAAKKGWNKTKKVFGNKSPKPPKKKITKIKIKRKTVDDLIKTAELGKRTKGKATQYLKQGGYKQALDDFRALGLSDIVNKGDVKIGKLSDGRTVNLRNKSKQGSITLEIYNPINRKSIKFRYER